jgi:aldehyde dehydrogenase (NAD+)
MNEELNLAINSVFTEHQLRKTDQKNTSLSYRKSKLLKFRNSIILNESRIQRALNSDFGKARLETSVTEILPIIIMINFQLKNLKKWMKPKKASFSPLYVGSKCVTSFEAKGNCLILSPWNYPFNLSIYPVLTAFAAGNTVILKPSEYTPNTNLIMRELLADVFSQNEICVIEGEVEASTMLLEKPFDHIFFTGSTPVGKIVMEKASKHLASVSLELGGKSPALLDKNYSIRDSVEKICWGKFVNSGQTCVAPDYVLLDPSSESSFIGGCREFIQNHYGNSPLESESYCQIITQRHGERLQEMIDQAVKEGAIVHTGGKFDIESRKFEPTIISNVSLECSLMSEEIFGPILPIIKIETTQEMLKFVNDKDNALALYVFSNNKNFIEEVRSNTDSGGFSVNETLLHIGHSDLPFGGAGKSGIGRYHSHHGFEELSNQRAVLIRKKEYGLSFFYPPYTSKKEKVLSFCLKYFSRFL